MTRFRDRRDAGRQLAAALEQRLAGRPLQDPFVLALPRGGVPVAAEVARALHAPLDVLVARKIGAPGNPEYGIGAVAEGGGIVATDRALRRLGIGAKEFDELVAAEQPEVERRVQRYRGGRPLPDVTQHDVVLVDDGLATGVTAEAGMRSLRILRAQRVVLAVPVAPPETVERLRLTTADDVVTVVTPDPFYAVGEFYDDFTQTTDDEVTDLLK